MAKQKPEVALSTEELEALLKQRKADERAEREAKRAAYEADRNELVVDIVSKAMEVSKILTAFKHESMAGLKAWFERMKEYGDAKEKQKNYQLLSADGLMKVVFTYSITKGFDERSKLAEDKLKLFLTEFVKKRDTKLYALVMGLLERNKVNGDLDISNINRLYALEDKFDDNNWRKALHLFKESYVEKSSKYYARFYIIDQATNNEVQVSMDFASI